MPVSRAPSGAAEESLLSLPNQGLEKGQASKESLQGKGGDNSSGRESPSNNQDSEKGPRRARSTRNSPFDMREMEEMENLLRETRGHLGRQSNHTFWGRPELTDS